MRKFLFIFLAAIWFSSGPVMAQRTANGSITASGTSCTTSGACVQLAVDSNTGAIGVVISGTYVGTLQFESTAGDGIWTNVPGDPLPTGGSVSSTTSTGTWVFNVAGLQSFRVRASAYTSGTANIAIRSSTAFARNRSFGNLAVANLNNIRFADEFPGADCGAKINAADADLGATAGEIWFSQNCGTAWSTAVVLTANHSLGCVQGGTYNLSMASPQITLASSGGMWGDRACILQMANGTNAQIMVNNPETALDVVIEGITLDGNRANNAGPYTSSQGLIWVGSAAAAAEDVRLTIRGVRLMNPRYYGIYGQHVSGVSVEDVVATGIGNGFILGQDCTPACPMTGWKITGNRFDYSQANFVGTITTNSTTTVTGSGFNTNWGVAGYDAVMHLSGGGNYTISSCASATTCTLTAAVTDPNGAYVGGVGQGIGIYYTNLSSSVICDNRTVSLPNGALEAINVSIGDYNVICNNSILFPAVHTVGAEGITMGNVSTGGSFTSNVIEGNTIVRPMSTGIEIIDNSASVTPIIRNNIVTGNTIVDANAINIGPGALPGGFDNGIRITGSGVDGTIVTDNNCLSTVTGAVPARRGFNYCVAVDNNGNQATNTIIGLVSFRASDTSGTMYRVRDNGSGTIFSSAQTDSVLMPSGSILGSGVIHSVTLTLTSAQIIALSATPIALVPAPGAGWALVPISATAVLNYVAVTYTLGANINLFVGPVADGIHWGAIATQATVQSASSGIYATSTFPQATIAQTLTAFNNRALNLSCSAAFATGDGTLTITLFYALARLS